MSRMLRGLAVAAYGILIGTQYCLAGSTINCDYCNVVDKINPLSVPEPTTLATLATGIAILGWARYRKRK